MKLTEKTINASISLTEHQKAALVKVFSAPTEKVAGDELVVSQQMVSARDTLNKVGLIKYNQQNGYVSLTDSGKEAMFQAGLLDDGDNITDEGKKYLKVGASSPDKEASTAFESFSLIREINNLIKN